MAEEKSDKVKPVERAESAKPSTPPKADATKKSSKKGTADKNKSEFYAAVLVRGLMGIRKEIRDTLFMLRLRKKHTCIIIAGDAKNIGMLKKCKDYIAYGPVSKETVEALTKARKSFIKDRQIFALAPPRGGFERGGIKKPFSTGGVLGARKEMDTLIKKMI